jgi:hypothetical protein
MLRFTPLSPSPFPLFLCTTPCGVSSSNRLEDTKMKDTKFLTWVGASMALLCAAAAPMFAQGPPIEGPVPTTALINVETKNGVTLDPSALKLQINRHEAPITSVTLVAPGVAQVAILIDDGLRSSFSLQLDDVRKFLATLPPKTQVLIGYMQNGTIRDLTDGFTTDHAAAGAALRMPFSSPGISASPYFCLSEFVKHWPSNQPGARFVLMVTNGVDPYNGRPSVLNQDSPYVQEAQEDAQRAGVAVYSIYYADSGMRGGRGSFSGQSYLTQVAQATGAEMYNQGTIPPPSIGPYLEMFGKAISESYLVSFQASSFKLKNDTLDGIKLSTSQPGVKIHAPESVHPGVTSVQ